MPSPIGVTSIGSDFRLDTLHCQGLPVRALVLEAAALLEPERMLEPIHVIAIRMISTVMGAAAFLARLCRHQRSDCAFNQIVEFQRFDTRGIEYPALITDLGTLPPLRDFFDFFNPFQ